MLALDIRPERLALSQGFGADVTIDPTTDDPVTAIKELTHGEGTDLALDCTGNPAARAAAVRSARAWEHMVMDHPGSEVYHRGVRARKV